MLAVSEVRLGRLGDFFTKDDPPSVSKVERLPGVGAFEGASPESRRGSLWRFERGALAKSCPSSFAAVSLVPSIPLLTDIAGN